LTPTRFFRRPHVAHRHGHDPDGIRSLKVDHRRWKRSANVSPRRRIEGAIKRRRRANLSHQSVNQGVEAPAASRTDRRGALGRDLRLRERFAGKTEGLQRPAARLNFPRLRKLRIGRSDRIRATGSANSRSKSSADCSRGNRRASPTI
jgi:hypothetical protein